MRADYWVDNLRQTVRFAGAVQAALEDGFRVFAELSPHPLLTRAVEQTAHDLETPAAALAACVASSRCRMGCSTSWSDLHSAGAAVDFAELYPDGRLVEVPLPTWTHSTLLFTRAMGQTRRGEKWSRAIHCSDHMFGCWRSPSGTPGRLMSAPPRSPWLADHQVHDVAALPGAAYCEMALAAADRLFPDGGAEVRDVRFEELLILDAGDRGRRRRVDRRTRRCGVRRCRPTRSANVSAAPAAALHGVVEDGLAPARRDVTSLLAAHPNTLSGEEIRQSLATGRGIEFGPAFTGLTRVHSGGRRLHAAGRTVRGTGVIRADQSAYGIHPAVLDACFQAVGAHLLDRAADVPVGYCCR